jgi:nucleoside-diphosphate-sugar epimerase
MKILVTGSSGFIAGYLIEELLNAGHDIVGIDNFSKYGPIKKSYSEHPHFYQLKDVVKNMDAMTDLIADCDQVVAGAAMIGGITYFHEYAYDLLAENERITAATFDAAIWAFKHKHLKKINILSSSMVYESATTFPSTEYDHYFCPPPSSTYGFQKLATEFFAKGAYEQYKLPFTIIRPFNCVGIGEGRALGEKEIYSGNVKLAMSHVVPDLVQKILKGQDPLVILGNGNQVRHYTYGGDLAKGIRACIENPLATMESFNLSTPTPHTVLELAEAIWKKINGSKPFRYESSPAFKYDVQFRSPDVSKAKEYLGFEAKTSLDSILNEVIPWIDKQISIGAI